MLLFLGVTVEEYVFIICVMTYLKLWVWRVSGTETDASTRCPREPSILSASKYGPAFVHACTHLCFHVLPGHVWCILLARTRGAHFYLLPEHPLKVLGVCDHGFPPLNRPALQKHSMGRFYGPVSIASVWRCGTKTRAPRLGGSRGLRWEQAEDMRMGHGWVTLLFMASEDCVIYNCRGRENVYFQHETHAQTSLGKLSVKPRWDGKAKF